MTKGHHCYAFTPDCELTVDFIIALVAPLCVRCHRGLPGLDGVADPLLRPGGVYPKLRQLLRLEAPQVIDADVVKRQAACKVSQPRTL
eukprot:scaffold49118_cov32-Prasinocladus_malaysianus.AAC.1